MCGIELNWINKNKIVYFCVFISFAPMRNALKCLYSSFGLWCLRIYRIYTSVSFKDLLFCRFVRFVSQSVAQAKRSSEILWLLLLTNGEQEQNNRFFFYKYFLFSSNFADMRRFVLWLASFYHPTLIITVPICIRWVRFFAFPILFFFFLRFSVHFLQTPIEQRMIQNRVIATKKMK